MRHPKIVAAVEAVLGEPACFAEISAVHMGSSQGPARTTSAPFHHPVLMLDVGLYAAAGPECSGGRSGRLPRAAAPSTLAPRLPARAGPPDARRLPTHALLCAPSPPALLSDLRVSPFARADLTDVDDTTPCMSISPEPVSGPILPPEEQIATRGIVDLVGPAGSVFLVSTGSFAG